MLRKFLTLLLVQRGQYLPDCHPFLERNESDSQILFPVSGVSLVRNIQNRQGAKLPTASSIAYEPLLPHVVFYFSHNEICILR